MVTGPWHCDMVGDNILFQIILMSVFNVMNPMSNCLMMLTELYAFCHIAFETSQGLIHKFCMQSDH